MRAWMLAVVIAVAFLLPVGAEAGALKLQACLEHCDTPCVERCDVRHLPRTGANKDCRAKCERKRAKCINKCNYKLKQR